MLGETGVDNIMSMSKNHHFIPQFLQNKFADENERFYVFDKAKRSFRKNIDTNDKFKSEKIFSLKHLNTIRFDNQHRTDLLEQYLTNNSDTPCSEVLKTILENFQGFLDDEKKCYEMEKPENERLFDKEYYQKFYEKKMAISYFIAQLFCRNPFNEELIREYLKNTPPKFKLVIDIPKNKEIAEILEKFFEEEVYKNCPDFEKINIIQKSMIEIFDLKNNNNTEWVILYGEKENDLNILCDNPILYRDFSRLQNFSELIMPISKDKTLIYGKRKIKEDEKRGGVNCMLNLAIFANAKEVIIGNNRTMMEKTAKLYFSLVDEKGEAIANNYFLEQLFECFE
jgi:hypothetical protein